MQQFSLANHMWCRKLSLVAAGVVLSGWLCIISLNAGRAGDHRLITLKNNRKQGCKCHSLFTVGACGLHESYPFFKNTKHWNHILSNLYDSRLGSSSISVTDTLHQITRQIPDVYVGENIRVLHDEDPRKPIYQYKFSINRTSIRINNTYSRLNNDSMTQIESYEANVISRVTPNLPHIPCSIHVYTKSEIKTCLIKRRILTGKILRIAFVGDSQVRNLLEDIILNLRVTLNLAANDKKGTNLTTDFLDNSAKIDLPILGDYIELRLYWSTFLGKNRASFKTIQGAKDLLEAWAQNKSTAQDEHVPDILYFDNGVWDPGNIGSLASVESVSSDYFQLLPYIKNITKTTRVLLRNHTPIKEWIALNVIPNGKLDLLSQLAWHYFADTDVWIWDTMTPVYMKDVDECRNHWKAGFAYYLPRIWACHDLMHPSKISEDVAANMIWNYVCNDILHIKNVCCSSNNE